MDTVLFNLNDVALLLVIFECLLLGLLLLALNPRHQLSQYLLALFLLAIGLDALDTIMFWSSELKSRLLDWGAYVFFVLKVSVFITAPTLYLYVKSMLFCDFTFTRRELVHYIPALIFLFYLMVIFQVLGAETIERGLFDFELLFHHPLFQSYLWARNIAYVGYGATSILLIARYRERLKQGFSNIANIDRLWLMILVGGFLGVWLSVFGSYLGHQLFESFLISDSLGVIGNYLNFIFINFLIVYNLVKSNAFQGINQQAPKDDAGNLAINTQHIQALADAMEEDELYLNPELTLEDLAKHVSLNTRSVSAIINSQLNKNFFEFVNEYRVAKAQSLLAEQRSAVPMLKVMENSGFNSKATFNRFFKKSTGMTPTEYRNKCSRKQLARQSGFLRSQRV